MAEQYVKRTVKTDYVGTYVEYEYSDGHLETSPPNRPQSQEDVQRERLAEASKFKAQRQLEEKRAKLSALGSTPSRIVRENLTALSGRDLTATYHNTLHSLATTASTIRGPAGLAKELVDNFDLGGEVVGDRAGLRPEYGDPTPDREGEGKPGLKEPRYPGRLR